MVNEYSRLTIWVDIYVKSFMDQEIISRPGADDLDIIDKCCFGAHLPIESNYGLTRRPIFVSSSLAYANNALWLYMELDVETALVVNHSE